MNIFAQWTSVGRRRKKIFLACRTFYGSWELRIRDLSVYCIGRTNQLPFTCGSRVLPIARHTELGKIPTFIAEETVLLLPFVFIKKLVQPQLKVQSSSAGCEHRERRVPSVGSSWARSSADAWGSKRPLILSLFLSVNFFSFFPRLYAFVWRILTHHLDGCCYLCMAHGPNHSFLLSKTDFNEVNVYIYIRMCTV